MLFVPLQHYNISLLKATADLPSICMSYAFIPATSAGKAFQSKSSKIRKIKLHGHDPFFLLSLRWLPTGTGMFGQLKPIFRMDSIP
jgi:hypothetical protein